MCIWNWFFAICSADLTCVNGSTIQLVLHELLFRINSWILNKQFKVINLFICYCSFITLAQKTIVSLQMVRFLETLHTATPHSWIIKTNVLFLYMFHWITIHFLIHHLPFKNFAVCCLFSITRALNHSWNRLNEVCFQLFVYGFIFSLKKWAYLKYERVLLYSNDRLVGFSSPSC